MIDLHKLDKFRLKDREREFYGCTGDSGNGVFKVYVGGKSFRVIASNNNHPYCLHLWRPVDTEIPHPPMICV